jgi:hypothetical protein
MAALERSDNVVVPKPRFRRWRNRGLWYFSTQSGDAQLEEVVDLGGAAGVAGGDGRLAEVGVEGGQHRFHAREALRRAELFREATLDDLQRDMG